MSDADRLRRVVGDDAVVELVHHLVEEARCARDIHVEPPRSGLRVRIRIDAEMDTSAILAVKAGFRPLMQDGYDKALEGLVALEDVLAVARAD